MYNDVQEGAMATRNTNSKPIRKTVSATEARQRWSDIVADAHAGKARYVIERSGLPVAAVVSFQDFERMTQVTERLDERLAESLSHIRAAFADVPADELDREVAKAVKEARAEIHVEMTAGQARRRSA
jgi:prevent-host-death family protein